MNVSVIARMKRIAAVIGARRGSTAGIMIHIDVTVVAADDAAIRVNIGRIVADADVRRAKFDFYLDNDFARRNRHIHCCSSS